MSVIGVGNGGCATVGLLAGQWPEGPELVAVNTDFHDLNLPSNVRAIAIGTHALKGRGTGGDPRLGRRAAEADLDALRPIFNDVNLVFLIVGLGGGTGTGATPLLAEEARKADALTLGLATLPFEFEGQRRMEQAERGLVALEEAADGVICLPNQRLLAAVADRANVAEAFQTASRMLGQGLQALWRVLCRKSVINLDFADVRTLLQGGHGRCLLGCAEGAGPEKVSRVLKAIRANPLLDQGRVLAQTPAFLVSLIGGPDLALQEVQQLMQGIAKIGRPEALLMTGVGCEPEWRDKVAVTVLAAERPGASRITGTQPVKSRSQTSPASAPTSLEAEIGGGRQKKPPKQGNLFDAASQGRFKDVDPTIMGGNNLDIPTYLRRGILIQKVHHQ